MSSRAIGTRPRRSGLVYFAVLAFLLLIGSRYIASTLIDYSWWSGLHQSETWLSLLLYGTGPVTLAVVLFTAAFWTAFRLGLRQAGDGAVVRLLTGSTLSRVAFLASAFLAWIVANATVNSWTVVRYFGGLRTNPVSEFVDPIFGKPLHFYFFALPFYNAMLAMLLVGAVLSLLIYGLASNVENISKRLPSIEAPRTFEFERISFSHLFHSYFVRLVAGVFLLGLAAHYYLARYDMLLEDHGSYLVGVNWVAANVGLPLQWLLIAGAIVAAALVLAKRAKLAILLLLIFPVRFILPSLVAGLYVRPNELALERPYIQHHIEATRAAYGLNGRVKEVTLKPQPEIPIDYNKHKALLDNVRLWDWRAFHDTVSQIQPLRPYVYMDTDVDRYSIDGQVRQVLVAPRELDIRQIGEARNRWINPHLIYTHGYGIVMAEANRITADGLPKLFIEDAPPVVHTKSLQLTKPEIYYGEVAHEPVFVDTKQQEFNYPTGSQEPVSTTYGGTGGFPATPLMRLAAAVSYSDLNTLITGYLNDKSRMMIHRAVSDRLRTLAGFVMWDSDPYMVVTKAGRLVWITDGYMTSDAHPYARDIELGNGQAINYIRNSVKATVDAYTGETNLYVFDEGDILIQAYRQLFPGLFKPSSAMPADLREHARYPEILFSAQAEIYRTFHMRDAESFYNRADLWDIARTGARSGESGAGSFQPTYVVATLPGETQPEFLLISPFTPANKDNLIGFMLARCDGEHLGELIFQQLGKQSIVYGPMQINARINQDQNISKDLTLWNQQGSQVLRGQTLVLPIDSSFLYVEPIYIQASQASMPQLKKVALAMGNRLSYADTYEQALASLIQQSGGAVPDFMPAAAQPDQTTGAAPATSINAAAQAGSPDLGQRLKQIRDHLGRYRELSSQGKWSEAGKELEEVQRLAQR